MKNELVKLNEKLENKLNSGRTLDYASARAIVDHCMDNILKPTYIEYSTKLAKGKDFNHTPFIKRLDKGADIMIKVAQIGEEPAAEMVIETFRNYGRHTRNDKSFIHPDIKLNELGNVLAEKDYKQALKCYEWALKKTDENVALAAKNGLIALLKMDHPNQPDEYPNEKLLNIKIVISGSLHELTSVSDYFGAELEPRKKVIDKLADGLLEAAGFCAEKKDLKSASEFYEEIIAGNSMEYISVKKKEQATTELMDMIKNNLDTDPATALKMIKPLLGNYNKNNTQKNKNLKLLKGGIGDVNSLSLAAQMILKLGELHPELTIDALDTHHNNPTHYVETILIIMISHNHADTRPDITLDGYKKVMDIGYTATKDFNSAIVEDSKKLVEKYKDSDPKTAVGFCDMLSWQHADGKACRWAVDIAIEIGDKHPKVRKDILNIRDVTNKLEEAKKRWGKEKTKKPKTQVNETLRKGNKVKQLGG